MRSGLETVQPLRVVEADSFHPQSPLEVRFKVRAKEVALNFPSCLANTFPFN